MLGRAGLRLGFLMRPRTSGPHGLPGRLMWSANGPSTPGLRSPLARTRHRCCLQAGTHPGQDPPDTEISELNTIQGGRAIPLPFVLTTFLCTLQPATSAKPLHTLAATLDTGPRRTLAITRRRQKINHSESARHRRSRASLGSPNSAATRAALRNSAAAAHLPRSDERRRQNAVRSRDGSRESLR